MGDYSRPSLLRSLGFFFFFFLLVLSICSSGKVYLPVSKDMTSRGGSLRPGGSLSTLEEGGKDEGAEASGSPSPCETVRTPAGTFPALSPRPPLPLSRVPRRVIFTFLTGKETLPSSPVGILPGNILVGVALKKRSLDCRLGDKLVKFLQPQFPHLQTGNNYTGPGPITAHGCY